MFLAVTLDVATLAGRAAAPAGAQTGSGTITGVVGPSGPSLPYRITVVAVSATGGPGATTEAEPFSGTYSLSLPPGTYYVWFIPIGRFSQLGPAVQLYLSASSYDAATPVVVNDGETTQLQPQAAAPQGATVAGQVSDVDGGTVADCDIAVITRTPVPTVVGGARTNISGAYEITNLPARQMDVAVQCGTGFVTTYHGDTTDPAGSVPIETAVGTELPGVDVTVARAAGSVAGTVTTTDGAAATAACVFAYSSDGTAIGASELRNDGAWAIANLPVGNVRIGFFSCHHQSPFYVAEWYDDTEDFAAATPVPVNADSATSGIDAVLTRTGSIFIGLNDPAANLVVGVCVWLTDVTGSTLVTVHYAGEGGAAPIHGLRPGTYSTLFTDCGCTGFAPEWYQDAPDHAASTPITVSEGETTHVSATLG